MLADLYKREHIRVDCSTTACLRALPPYASHDEYSLRRTDPLSNIIDFIGSPDSMHFVLVDGYNSTRSSPDQPCRRSSRSAIIVSHDRVLIGILVWKSVAPCVVRRVDEDTLDSPLDNYVQQVERAWKLSAVDQHPVESAHQSSPMDVSSRDVKLACEIAAYQHKRWMRLQELHRQRLRSWLVKSPQSRRSRTAAPTPRAGRRSPRSPGRTPPACGRA